MKQDGGGMRPSMHARQTSRRRATSNYQTLDDQVAERSESISASITSETKSMMKMNPSTSSARGVGIGSGHASIVRSAAVFELLQAKFGFQEGSVRNQREHFDGWVLNYESRTQTPEPDEALRQIHAKFFKNYMRWCTFLKTKPYDADLHAPSSLVERQVALFFLIWGEAANLRFMPECLCFIYHSLASKLDGVERLPNVAEGSFLRRVVRPIYLSVAKMRTAAEKKRTLDHKNISNYDDVNEFFWTPRCLDFDELNVAEAIGLQELKTFKERRSFFNPLLGFFRIYFFLLVMFHALIVIAYIAYRSDPPLQSGLTFYSKFFSDTITDIRSHAFFSIFLSVSGLLALKVVLEVWMGGALIFAKATYACALCFRLCWHAVFFALFAAVNASPYEVVVGDQDLLSLAPNITGVYVVPVLMSSMLKMCCSRAVFSNGLLSGFDGTREQYVGRNMGQSWGAFLAYGAFWTLLFILKFVFNLQLMIKPLIGPSFEIFDIQPTARSMENGLIESDHNIAFLIAMWIPVFLVYLYDSQIWLAIMQSIVGVVIGLRLKISNSSRMSEFVARLKLAPGLFDSKVVSHAARGQLSVETNGPRTLSAAASAPDANSRLRFAVVWNEIVSSFRLSDLLDDRETAILQYQISDSGAVEDPVFLIAGQAQVATDIAARAKSRRLDDPRLKKELQKAGVIGCALNCIDITFQILRQLLGPADAEVIQVFDQILHSDRIMSVVNLIHVPLLRENIIDLLASILDLPEPTIVPNAKGTHTILGLQQDQVVVIVQRVDALLKSVELMLEEEWMAEKVRQCVFAKMTPDLAYQKQQLLSILDRQSHVDQDNRRTSPNSNESVIALSTRLFFLLTLDAADALPRCHEARRRMSFFLNSLSMKMPSVKSIASMHSFSVITPYYNEPVLYSVKELNGRVNSNPLFRKVEQKGRDLSILKYLITFHNDEWGNFLERVGATTIEEALAETPTQVRLWASMRGQTLARTVHGMMLYEDALKMLRWLEIGSDQNVSHLDKIKQMDRIAGLKFSYVTSCQLYSEQLASGDSHAADIDLLMRKYPNWRVSYVDTINPAAGSGQETCYDCVLVKSDGDEIVEVYRYELPGNPFVGEGKPENQNVAIPFTRGEYVQTIDMNQEHYFEEALKIPNFLATATENGANVSIIGMKEHIFTGRASSLAHFMTLQELVFVSLTQRVLARPLRSRMHYGHPDVFDKSFVMSNGGVSKASKGINLSEDVFSGYNAALRGEHVTHVEFMQCGKGRDVTLSQINAFEAKLSNGSAESSLSRDAHRMGAGMDFFRLNSMFYGHMGFYICNALTVFCVFAYAYGKLYIAVHEDVQDAAIVKTDSLDDLADVLNTQFIFQFGMLMTIPLIATLFVEYGWRQAIVNFIELIVTLGPLFYIFETGTKAHFYDVAIMRGGSKYRGTGRGFAIIRETLVNFFKEYAASHYRKAVELLGIMIIFGVYGNFSIGTSALEDYCESINVDCTTEDIAIPENITLLRSYGSKGQDYGVASFAVWLLGTTWLLAPFFFNTDGMDFPKTRVDVAHWLHWMMAIPGADIESLPSAQRSAPSDTWLDFYYYEMSLIKDMRWTGRLAYAIRELRHPLTMYYIFIVSFDLKDMALLGGCVLGVSVLLWLGGAALGAMARNKAHVPRAILYLVLVVGGVVIAPLVIGSLQSWTFKKSASLIVGIFLGLYSVLQYLTLLHGVMKVPVAKLGLVQELAFFFDMTVGVFLIVPLVILSAFPFMRTIQTRMMYNVSFSQALSTGSEFAASLSLLIGLLGGWAYGWLYCLVFSLGYVNSREDNFLNLSFVYFVNERLEKQFETEMLKVYAALAGAVGVIFGTWIAHTVGRRPAIMTSCIVAFCGVGLVFVTSSTLILIGCCVVIAGVAMLSISCLLYNFEICVQGWKGKGVLLFLFGSSLGYLVEAIVLENINVTAITKAWQNDPLHDWQFQFVFGAVPMLLLLPLMFFLPESPVWLYRNRDIKSAENTLVKLRQKHDVMDELDDLKGSFVNKSDGINVFFRIMLVLVLQAAFALMTSSALLRRIFVKPAPEVKGAETSMWLIWFGLTNFVGVSMGLLTVDNVRRKTIFKDILPLASALSLACGVLSSASLDSVIIDALLVVLFASAALSLTCATWLTAIEVFPPYQNSRFIAVSFGFYYLVQALVYYALPSFAISHYVFAALCTVLTIAMFAMCASTKAGAIELKSEKKARLKQEASLSGDGEEDELVPSFVARVSRSQSLMRSRSRVRRSSSHHATRTPREGDYENFDSPAAGDKPLRRTMNGSIQKNL